MHHYRVSDTSARWRAVALQDRAGRYHIAHATAAVPDLGLYLYGHPPSLGFHILLAASNRQVFRLIFELIDCSGQAAADHLHA